MAARQSEARQSEARQSETRQSEARLSEGLSESAGAAGREGTADCRDAWNGESRG